MILKKVLAMVLTKYYYLQTLQNPMKFQNFRRSIKSRLAQRKVCDSAAAIGRGRQRRMGGRAGGRFGSETTWQKSTFYGKTLFSVNFRPIFTPRRVISVIRPRAGRG